MLASQNMYGADGNLSLELTKDFPAAYYLLTLKDLGGPVTKINDDVDLFEVIKKAENAEDLYKRIEYRGRVNSLGRRTLEVIFQDKTTFEEPVTKKLFGKIAKKVAPDGKWVVEVFGKVQRLAMIVNEIMGGDIGMNTFKLQSDLEKHRDEVLDHPEKYDVSKELADIANEFAKRQSEKGQYIALTKESGGGKCDFQQVSVAKGYVSDVNGNVDPNPIRSNFTDGFTPTDYFRSASGNRKGVCDRVLNTAASGYLSRQLVFLAASVKSGNKKFCGTKKTFDFILTKDLFDVVKGRMLKDGSILTEDLVEKRNLWDKPVSIYSPLYCQSRELCECCYPTTYRKYINNIPNVGIIAAHSIGERATQLTMTTFHCFNEYSTFFIKHNDNIEFSTFHDFWKRIDNEILNTMDNQQEEKNVDNYEVFDNGKWTKINKIIRHHRHPESEMVFVKTSKNDLLMAQDNHPIMNNNNKIVELKNSMYCNVIVSNFLWEQNENFKSNENIDFVNKIIPFDFIHYSDDILINLLNKFLDGNNFIESSSLTFVIQIKAIAEKVNYYIDSIEFVDNKFIIKFNNNKIIDYDKIIFMKSIQFNEEDYVYDFETESHTMTVNNIWCHNTGGASKVVYLNTECPETKEFINQEGLNLYATKDLKIKVLKPASDAVNTFPSKKFIIYDNGEEINVDFTAVITFDGLAAKSVVEDGQDVIMEFEKTVQIGVVDSAAVDVTSAVLILQSILNHGDRMESPEAMVMELYETFKANSKLQLLYYEILVSQIIRDPKKPSNPYRLGSMTEEPIYAPIKRVPMLESPIRGLMFERVSDIIANDVIGLTDYEHAEQKSDLEDIFRI